MALFLKTELNSWAVLSYFLEKRKCTYKLNMTEQNLYTFKVCTLQIRYAQDANLLIL